MTVWTETFSGGNFSSWPAGWSTVGTSNATTSATVVSGRGRLSAGSGVAPTGSTDAVKVRLDRMADQVDSDVTFTFTPPSGAWFFTVGARTRDNGSILDNYQYSDRGMYANVSNFFGSNADFRRWAQGSWFDLVTDVPTVALPSFTGGTAYKLRFRVRGYGIYLRVWLATDPEPTAWNMAAVDIQAWTGAGKLVISHPADFANNASSIDFDDITVTGLDPDPDLNTEGSRHLWTMWSRSPTYNLDTALPIMAVEGVRKHLGVSRATITTPFTPAAYNSLQPGHGVVLFRDGRQVFTGLMQALELDWDDQSTRVVIKAECVGDEQHLQDRTVFPDPLRAADDQTVTNYWRALAGGVPAAVVASTAMLQLISDQAGPTCRADRRVSGLTLAADPAAGISRGWNGLFARDDSVLGLLAVMSVASGANLGVRVFSQSGSLVAQVYVPRDLSAAVKFSVEFGNVAGLSYRIEAPTVTHALAAGQGDLKLRVRKLVSTTSSFALSFGRQIWAVIDRRDTADTTELTAAAQDAQTDGDATVSLSVTLLDSQAARYGVDWDLGDKVTVYLRLPGQDGPVATVSDVIREIAFSVDSKGQESIRPAIGTFDAKSVIPTPTQKQLLKVRNSLAGLIANQ